MIRPAIDTLRALGEGKTLDELALHLNSACDSVRALAAPANHPDALTCPRCGGGTIAGLDQEHEPGCDLAALLHDLDP